MAVLEGYRSLLVAHCPWNLQLIGYNARQTHTATLSEGKHMTAGNWPCDGSQLLKIDSRHRNRCILALDIAYTKADVTRLLHWARALWEFLARLPRLEWLRASQQHQTTPFLAAESSSLAKISMSAECKYSLATSAIHRESGTLTSIDFGCLQSGLESDLFYYWLHANFFAALLRFHFRLGWALACAQQSCLQQSYR